MSIAFSNTQGDVTITVNDNTIDQTRYSLTLLGRNVTNYGQHIAQNTIRQLENFASPNQPNPSVKLVGQLWYDKTGEHLRVYRGATDGFQELGFRPVLTGSNPSTNVQNGELYFNTTSSIKNLKIYTGSAWENVISDGYIRGRISVTDTAGDGALSYDNSTGVITYAGVTDAQIRSKFSGGTGVTYTSGTGAIAIGQAVETNSNVRFNDIVIDGDLTVNGTQTVLNTETLTVDDNLIVLNNNEAGTPSQDAGIEVERGTSTNVKLQFKESTDVWQFTNDGSTFYPIATSTSDLAEGTNLYYTNARADARIAAATTDDLSEGSSNLYYTDVRARAAISEGSAQLSYNSSTGVLSYTQGDTDTVAEGSGNLYYTQARFDTAFGNKTTSNLIEGSNLYFTTARGNSNFDTRLATKSTTNLAEGTNLYFTDARVDARITKGAIDALNVDADTLDGVDSTSFLRSDQADSHTHTITPNTDNSIDLGSTSKKYRTVYATTFSGTASQAQYADLAENYLADKDYDVGTVLIFGGSAEVSVTSKQNCPSIAGVVSENPAYLMNSELEGNHVTSVALKGRVPVKVVGPIRKGDILIHSQTEGHAQAAPFGGYHVTGPCCIGVAISEKADAGAGVVEALVR
mgnify:CR=1 FL=1|tara:strand:- start:4544 stop:6436 length:1893 start_codon:yes stop_codon:yes gene_type:complete